MVDISCRECRTLLPAYISRELTPAQRSAAAAHLDGCDRCHAEYARQRNAAADLRAELPALGHLDTRRAGLLWQSIQQDMSQPRRVLPAFGQGRMSLALLLVAAALALPWLMNSGRLAALSLPLPPTPVSATDVLATDAPLTAFVGQPVALRLTPPGAPEYAPTEAPNTPIIPTLP